MRKRCEQHPRLRAELAESDLIDGGGFAWVHFQLDGGNTGREADLELSGASGQHWHLNAFVLR